MPKASQERALVIVESPTKARTIGRFLGKDFVVKASNGHIRDLPNSASEIPAKLRKEPWARLGVNVEKDFEPLYVISPDKKDNVKELKAALKEVDRLYFATDEDREGESISWHLVAGAAAESADQPAGVPRDHQGSDRPFSEVRRAKST